MGFLLSEKKVPAQNEAFQDLINQQISCFSGKLTPARVQSNLDRNPGAKSANTPPNRPVWGAILRIGIDRP